MSRLKLKGSWVNADCEHLPFKDAAFDFVSASGVLHHTPNPPAGTSEILRVLKPGGRAAISLYYQNILLRPALLPVTLWVMRVIGVQKPDAKLGQARSLDEFGALYDGSGNPLGRIYSRREALELVNGFEIDPRAGIEVHYFPRRFMPFRRWVQGRVFQFLDRALPTMIYLKVRKPE